ncbi:MAG: hypothetical protein OJF49_004011 [Ktedonobacterales bacterium]|jgi:chromosome segregation ATPase|nr:MAG: hypothetical protein OJF49_004011 [Ktedonobacterales bacterium]
MQEMDRRLALLRLLLADLTDRERQAHANASQLRAQLRRIVDFTIQYNGGVGNALAGMSEVEERITQIEATLRHLEMLRHRAESELHALIVTRDISDARARLAELESRRATLLEDTSPANENGELAALAAEIASLRAEIRTASDAVARTLTHGEQ